MVEYKDIFSAGAPRLHNPFAAFRTDPAPQTVANLRAPGDDGRTRACAGRG